MVDSPKHLVIAEALRAAIARGELSPGDRLPTEAALMAEHGVASMTVRAAISALRSEGLVTSRRGSGVYVREVPPVRRIASSRYQADMDQVGRRDDQPRETSFTRDQGLAWADYQLDKEFEEQSAPPAVAAALELDPGTPVLARHFVFRARGQAQQISDSYLPLDLVAGTPVADPDNEPWPGGNIAQLATLGVLVDRVTEVVTARMPTADERDVLQIPAGVPVLAITRTMYADGRPVEVAADIVLPADRTQLTYEIRLSPPDPDA